MPEKSKQRAESYLNVSAEIIIAMDRQGVINIMNDSGHRLLGCKPGELIGKNCFETCYTERKQEELNAMIKKIVL